MKNTIISADEDNSRIRTKLVTLQKKQKKIKIKIKKKEEGKEEKLNELKADLLCWSLKNGLIFRRLNRTSQCENSERVLRAFIIQELHVKWFGKNPRYGNPRSIVVSFLFHKYLAVVNDKREQTEKINRMTSTNWGKTVRGFFFFLTRKPRGSD